MKTINLSEQNSVLSQYLAEIRDIEYQKNRLLFRNNIRRIGEMMAFEISKALTFEPSFVETPLGTANLALPKDKLVIATVLRAGLPFHEGFLHGSILPETDSKHRHGHDKEYECELPLRHKEKDKRTDQLDQRDKQILRPVMCHLRDIEKIGN